MKQLLWAALFVLSLPSLAWARPGILSDTASNFLLIAVIVLILILAYFVILSKRR
jgi:antibiotic biosynthesis monooxygenase (ABM) superfamily enzyme